MAEAVTVAPGSALLPSMTLAQAKFVHVKTISALGYGCEMKQMLRAHVNAHSVPRVGSAGLRGIGGDWYHLLNPTVVSADLRKNIFGSFLG